MVADLWRKRTKSSAGEESLLGSSPMEWRAHQRILVSCRRCDPSRLPRCGHPGHASPACVMNDDGIHTKLNKQACRSIIMCIWFFYKLERLMWERMHMHVKRSEESGRQGGRAWSRRNQVYGFASVQRVDGGSSSSSAGLHYINNSIRSDRPWDGWEGIKTCMRARLDDDPQQRQ